MSCYIVSEKQILLISAVFADDSYQLNMIGDDMYFMGKLENACKALTKANFDNVNERYQENQQPYDALADFRAESGKIKENKLYDYLFDLVRSKSIVEKLKLVQNYEYQSCEASEWDTCEAKKICERVTSKLITKLDGYDKAKWGI